MISSARRARAPTAMGLYPPPVPAELKAEVSIVVSTIIPGLHHGQELLEIAIAQAPGEL